MKRILPFLLAAPIAAYAFACSSSDSNNSSSTNDGGTNSNTGDTTGDGGGTTTPAEEATTNPAEGVTPASAAQIGAGIDGVVYSPAENATFVAIAGLSDPFDGVTPVSGKILRVDSTGNVSGVFGGTTATGNVIAAANSPTAGQLLVAGYQQIVTVSNQTDAGTSQPGTVFASAVMASSGDDGGAGTFTGLKDFTVASDGSVFATEPNFNVQPEVRAERIYHITSSGSATVVKHFDNAEHPNGIVLSVDQKTLYVVLASPSGIGGYGTTPSIWKYSVGADGALSGEAKFADIGTAAVNTAGYSNPGQLAIDRVGNVYVAAATGVIVYKPSGDVWGTIALPGNEAAASVAFGGADMKTLYIGAADGGDGTLYKATLKVTGIKK